MTPTVIPVVRQVSGTSRPVIRGRGCIIFTLGNGNALLNTYIIHDGLRLREGHLQVGRLTMLKNGMIPGLMEVTAIAGSAGR